MDITKARKLVQLSRDNRKILVTLWDGDKISSCVSPGANGGSCVIVKPVGLAEGDLMFAHIAVYGSINTPDGWTQIRTDSRGVTSYLFWKIADGDDVAASNFTFTSGYNESNRGVIVAFETGTFDADTPINANSGGNQASATVTAPTITPSVANCMILMVCSIADNNLQSAYAIADDNPASWNEAYDLPSDLSQDLGLSMGYALRPETSATGNGTATTSASDNNIGNLLAIAPAAAPPAKGFSHGYIIG